MPNAASDAALARSEPPGPLTSAQRLLLEQRLLEARGGALRAIERGSGGWTRGADGIPREIRLLAEIDGALSCLYHRPHLFGRDEATGEPIPFEQLEQVPWSRVTRPMSRPPAAG